MATFKNNAGFELVVEAVQQSKIGRKRKVDNALNQKRRNIFGAKTNCETASVKQKIGLLVLVSLLLVGVVMPIGVSGQLTPCPSSLCGLNLIDSDYDAEEGVLFCVYKKIYYEAAPRPGMEVEEERPECRSICKFTVHNSNEDAKEYFGNLNMNDPSNTIEDTTNRYVWREKKIEPDSYDFMEVILYGNCVILIAAESCEDANTPTCLATEMEKNFKYFADKEKLCGGGDGYDGDGYGYDGDGYGYDGDGYGDEVQDPSPCFIATAAYGTPLHEDIDILRDFRDEYLMPNPIGRTFVKNYYTTSPLIADVIRENKGLMIVVREGLVKPLVYISRVFVR